MRDIFAGDLRAAPAFIQRAHAAKRDAVHRIKQEKDALKAICDDLHSEGQGASRDQLARELLGGPHALADQSFSFVPAQVPQLQRGIAITPVVLDQLLSEQTNKKLVSDWEMRHVGILHASTAAVPIPNERRQPCLDAQRCVCNGDGLADLRFFEKLRGAFRQWRGEDTSWILSARSADIVLLFAWEDRPCKQVFALSHIRQHKQIIVKNDIHRWLLLV